MPHDIYVQIAGIDVVRTGEDDFYVLEDNVRTPSGVSYMLENREVMMRLVPDLFAEHRVAPIENYPDALLAALRSRGAPGGRGEPTIVLLTPGRFNSAYYEHSFLADKLGVELVEGRDLLVEDDSRLYAHDRGREADRCAFTAASTTISSIRARSDRNSVLGVAGPDATPTMPAM